MNSNKHHSCTVIRRRLVAHAAINVVTGIRTEGAREWETAPCGAPLFSDQERVAGKCRSCAAGWTHPNNYPAPLASAPKACGCAPAVGCRECGWDYGKNMYKREL